MLALRRRQFIGAAALVLTACPALSVAQAPAKVVDRPEVKVGDKWKFERRDPRTNQIQSTAQAVVTAVSPDKIDVSYGNGPGVWTPDLNLLDSPRLGFDAGYQFLNFPLELDKKWSFKTKWINKANGNKGRSEFDVQVKGQDRIKTPAGEFDAYKLEARGYMNFDAGGSRKVVVTYWYAQQAKAIARMEWVDRSDDFVSELMEFTLTP